jgi:hypothetical protein
MPDLRTASPLPLTDPGVLFDDGEDGKLRGTEIDVLQGAQKPRDRRHLCASQRVPDVPRERTQVELVAIGALHTSYLTWL